MMRFRESSKVTKRIIKTNIKRYWPLPVLGLLVLMISGPLITIMLKDAGEEAIMSNYYVSRFNIGQAFATIMLGIGSGLMTFNYLVNKQASAYMHSLPIKRKKLFFAHYISGSIMILIPLVVNAQIMVILTGAGYAEVLLGQIISTMLMYSITVMAACISGTFLMHLFASGFFNGLVLMVTLVINSYLGLLLFGYQTPHALNEIIKSSLPVFGFRNGLEPVTTAIYIFVIVLMMVSAYLTNNIRAVEKTGDSLVFGWMKTLMIGSVAFLGAGLFGLILDVVFDKPKGINTVMLIGILFGFTAAFVVISLIVGGLRNMKSRESIKAAVVTALLIALCLVIPAADVTGYSSKVPDKNDVEYACVKAMSTLQMASACTQAELFNTEYENISVGGVFDFSSAKESLLKLEDKRNIAEACKIQKIIVNRKNAIINVERDTEPTYSYAAVFSQGGSLMKRGYDLIDTRTYKIIKPHLKKIFESDEYKSAFALSNLKYSIGSINYRNEGSDDGSDIKDVLIPKSKIKELIGALDKDFAKVTYEQYTAANDYDDAWKNQQSFEIHLKIDKDDEPQPNEFVSDSFYNGITIYISSAYENTNKWIKDNIK